MHSTKWAEYNSTGGDAFLRVEHLDEYADGDEQDTEPDVPEEVLILSDVIP